MINYKCKDFGSIDNVYIESVRATWDVREQEWHVDWNDVADAEIRCSDCNGWNIEEHIVFLVPGVDDD